ncbi:hypothetical protein IAG44_00870 [Streptomyces roseirectus]|uniref:Ricin B lectin domain-containing protein n=1 Tax=Streptomyces roseirectus TaxID=2768066 RepID=A0A7H0I5U3_9ACTN|nr:hypothetical protein [Streptomyces roseirectus]QNP68159.1 hypothetical protein IAG44_00870 [Streptomyces roseirectus]
MVGGRSAHLFIADFSVQQAGGALEEATGTPNVNSGGNLIRGFEAEQVLEAGAGSTENGATISQWTPLNHSYQAWTIQ